MGRERRAVNLENDPLSVPSFPCKQRYFGGKHTEIIMKEARMRAVCAVLATFWAALWSIST